MKRNGLAISHFGAGNQMNFSDVWQLLVALIVVVFWFARLEFKAITTERDLRDFKKHVKEDIKEHRDHIDTTDQAIWSKLDSVQSTLNQVLVSLGELKGELKGIKSGD